MGGRFDYDRIGAGYSGQRQEDPRLLAPILAALGSSGSVVNIGAGSGSYEPADRFVIAVEPSELMVAQRPAGRAPAVRAVAGALPFPTGSFDAALAVMTVHHWPEPAAGLEEMRRVASRRVVLTFDPEVHNRTWLVQYVPELARLPSARRPSVQEVADGIRATSVVTVAVPHDCRDGMMVAFWRRPEAYLDRRIHAGASALQQVEPDALRRGLARLERDLASGEWERRYGHLLQYEEWDCGLRLVWGDGG